MRSPPSLAWPRAPSRTLAAASASSPTSANRFGRLTHLPGDLEESARHGGARVRTPRCRLEVARIFEGVIHAESDQGHDQFVSLDDRRHGCNDDIARRAHQEIDLIDVEQLRVNARHG